MDGVAHIRALYERAAAQLIDSGACDAYQAVEDCPGYRALEEHYALATEAMCLRSE